jgi:hypothetical protein
MNLEKKISETLSVMFTVELATLRNRFTKWLTYFFVTFQLARQNDLIISHLGHSFKTPNLRVVIAELEKKENPSNNRFLTTDTWLTPLYIVYLTSVLTLSSDPHQAT